MDVADIMTRDLLALPVGALVGDALDQARLRDVHHVLLVDGPQLRGIACVCQLRECVRTDGLAGCIGREPEVIGSDISLVQAAHEFVQAGVSCFPVCDGSALVGVLTRSDVIRHWTPESALPQSFECAYCRGTRHVRARGDSPAICLDCADRSAPATAEIYELGDND